MESAVHVRSIRDAGGEYDRVYLGDEFCERLLPTVRQLEKALKISDKKITLATPPLTDKGLAGAKKLLSALPGKTEVVVNDWGLLDDVKGLNLSPVLGRLLLKYHRDPRVELIDDKIPKGCRKVLHSSALTQERFVKFLKKNRIRRIELDAVPFEVDHGDLSGFKASLHVPYAYVTTTRQCLANYFTTGRFGIRECRKQCIECSFPWESQELAFDMVQKGNTLFIEGDSARIPQQCDRIVHHPQI
ncbi:MAG: hypothetical protein ABH834_03265 [Candidatus Altiarchaeota archaeon]